MRVRMNKGKSIIKTAPLVKSFLRLGAEQKGFMDDYNESILQIEERADTQGLVNIDDITLSQNPPPLRIPRLEVHPFHTEEAQQTLVLIDKIRTILNVHIPDALGAPFEFADVKETRDVATNFVPDLHMLDAGGASGQWPIIRKAGQWTDDAAQADCWTMALIYAKDFIKKRAEQGKPALNEQQRKNLYKNTFARLMYQWYSNSLNTGLTPAQQKSLQDGGYPPSIGCGSVARHFINYWAGVEHHYRDRTGEEDFLLTYDTDKEFDTYITVNKIDTSFMDGNATTMRNAPSAVFASSAEEAMRLAYYQASTTTVGSEAIACAALQAYLTYKAMHSKLNPEQCKESIFSAESMNEFLELYQGIHGNIKIPDIITNLCWSEPSLVAENKDWLNWRDVGDKGYQMDMQFSAKNPRGYYGAYATKGLALVFYVINHTHTYEDAMKMLAELAGDADSNCAAAHPILAALYGSKGIKQEYDDAVNQHTLTQGRQFDKHTAKIKELCTPPGVEEAKPSDLIDAAVASARPDLCQSLDNLTRQVHIEVENILELLPDGIDHNDEVAIKILRQANELLKDMDDEQSIEYKRQLLTKISGGTIPKNVRFVTAKEYQEKNLNWEFLKQRYLENVTFYLYDEEQKIYTRMAPQQPDALQPIAKWKLKFHSRLERVKGISDFEGDFEVNEGDRQALFDYLRGLEYDPSTEAEEFKCAAFWYLLDKHPLSFNLAKILGCESYELFLTRLKPGDTIGSFTHWAKTAEDRPQEPRLVLDNKGQVYIWDHLAKECKTLKEAPPFKPAEWDAPKVMHISRNHPFFNTLASELSNECIQYGQVITEQHEHFMAHGQINLNTHSVYRYQAVITALANRDYSQELPKHFTAEELVFVQVNQTPTYTEFRPPVVDTEVLPLVRREKPELIEEDPVARFEVMLKKHIGSELKVFINQRNLFIPDPDDESQPIIGGPVAEITLPDTNKGCIQVDVYPGNEGINAIFSANKLTPSVDHQNGTIYYTFSIDPKRPDEWEELIQNLTIMDPDTTKIPIFGAGGKGSITVTQFEEALKQDTKNKDLKLKVVKETEHTLELEILNTKDNPFLGNGMVPFTDRKEPYYKLTINKDTSSMTLPERRECKGLFGITWRNTGGQFVYGSPSLVKHLSQQEKEALIYVPPEPLVCDEKNQALLASMRGVNTYLTQQATKSGFFHSSNYYYKTRKSWESVLEKMDKCANGEITQQELARLIKSQIDSYRGNRVAMKHDVTVGYCNQLESLLGNISSNTNLQLLKGYIRLYRQAYAYMDNCKKAAKEYCTQFRDNFHPKGKLHTLLEFFGFEKVGYFKKIFDRNREIHQHVREASDLYHLAYAALRATGSKADLDAFLKPGERGVGHELGEESMAEYRNIRNLKHK